jgi:hypothetical protein
LLLNTTVYAQIIPANRVTTWQPGVTNNGGIPNRTTIYTTLTPSGGDDQPQIQNAINNCPSGQVVQLSAGTFYIKSSAIFIRTDNMTLRGMGPDKTKIVTTQTNAAALYLGHDQHNYATSINLAADAVKGTSTLTLASPLTGVSIGETVLIDIDTRNYADTWYSPQFAGNPGSETWFGRAWRTVGQIMEVTAISGNTVTFATPFHLTFPVANQAQLTVYGEVSTKWSGVEDIYFTGGLGGQGNATMSRCSYCWFKHIESDWGDGPVHFNGVYRSELRDSYLHGTPNPTPGGSGYLFAVTEYSSDNLVENNIMWYGNKNITTQRAGGGNVVAYNYMDDAFGGTYPESPEAGLNAAHYTTPYMELLEGNYSPNYKGDDYWGNSIYITVFRNHLSAIRAAHPPLNTYMSGPYPYMDLQGRMAVDVQAHSYYTNFVGNVLGKQGQVLLSYSSPGFSFTQTSFAYENVSSFPNGAVVYMWDFGPYQDASQNWQFDATTINTQLRQGNWDFVSQKQRWHGIGGSGSTDATAPQTIPNSLYLTSAPAFFGNNPWPWVDPSTGTTYTLPAKARFDAGTPNQIQNTTQSNNNTVAVSASPSNGGTAAGGGTFASGSSDTVTATPTSGYTFTNWTENGAVVSSAASYTFTPTANRNLVANFTQNQSKYTVAVSASPSNGGTAAGGGTIASGSSATVTATANSGYTFKNWTEGGSVVSSAASYTFTPTANRNLVANFTTNAANYSVGVSASPSNGGAVAGGGTTFASGSSDTVTATANSGYTFKNWTENSAVVSSAATYTFAVTANHNLVANFTANPVTYSVAVSASPSNGGTVTGGGTTFASGSSDTVTATANGGFSFVNWTENGVVVSTPATYPFTVTANRNLVANFVANPATNPLTATVAVTASPTTGGTTSGGGTFASGSSRTVTAAAQSGYVFDHWTANGTVVSTAPSFSFILNSNRALVANFKRRAVWPPALPPGWTRR